ncbi:MAG: AAA family ATPase [Lachnospiraceae bacterium]
MTEKYTVTITREFGSMGRPIARKLSEILNIEFYDRDIVEETAKKMDLPLSVISKAEENQGGAYSKMKFPLGRFSKDRQDEIFKVQSELIRNLAEKESCVIVGRCADYVLKDFDRCLNIYIYAPFESRIENCVKYLGMDKDVAMKMIIEIDKARKQYHKKYANYYPADVNNKNLMIDSSFFGVEKTADLIAMIVKDKFIGK